MAKQQKIKKISMGVIGLGNRAVGHIRLLLDMNDIEITAVCDVYQDRIDRASDMINDKTGKRPEGFLDYNELLAQKNVDLVMVITSWTTHVEIAAAALKAGKPVGMEVGGACSLEELWDLVKTYEQTKTPFMFLENCCYGREEMAVLNIAKQGLFGELIHLECGYEHDIRDEVGTGTSKRHYRQDNYLNRNGEVYPTHGLGPTAKLLGINRGNRMVSLTSMASKARGMHEWIVNNPEKADPIAHKVFNQGDIVTTMVKCAGGETIYIIHDTTLPRPYSRAGRVQGTKGLWMEDNRSIYFEGVSPSHKWEAFDPYMEKYEHPLWKSYIKSGVRGGHNGMDFLVVRAFIESWRDKKPMPIDVYDAASWMAITVLSEQSVALGSAPVWVPDFTNGKWIHEPKPEADKYSLETIPESVGDFEV